LSQSAVARDKRDTVGRGASRRKPANVVLVGLSGSGKSTVGRLLARMLGWRFVDTDREIERQNGKSVQQIFREDGEPAFRAIEAAVVRLACAGRRQIVATGGGAMLDEDNRSTMLRGNLVVWLETSPELLVARLTPSVSREPRPLLEGDLASRLSTLEEQRSPVYRQAHLVIRTDDMTPHQVAKTIMEAARGH
jgi:shikimate kinase